MAFGAAEHGRETRDAFGIHQRRIGGRDFLGDDDAAFGNIGERIVMLLQQIADQPRADLADIRRRAPQDRRSFIAAKLALIAAIWRWMAASALMRFLLDQFLDAAHEARAGQHALIGFEQTAPYRRRPPAAIAAFCLQLAQAGAAFWRSPA